MIRHIVLFRLADGVRPEDAEVQQAVAAEHRLAEKIPGGGSWRFGPSVTSRDLCADFAGVGDFDSLDTLGRFLGHPAHLDAAKLWKNLASWTVADLDLGGPSGAEFDVLRFATLRTQPWRNGGGQTRELAAEPGGHGFAWRLSIADVDAGGPFSAFPGVDRVITLCDGPGMSLLVDGVEHELAPDEPFRFPGEAKTSCRISAPTRDLNVMTRRGTCTADMRVVPAAGELVARPGETTFAVLLSGTATVESHVELHALDTLRLVPGTVCQIEGDGRLAVVRITPEEDQ